MKQLADLYKNQGLEEHFQGPISIKPKQVLPQESSLLNWVLTQATNAITDLAALAARAKVAGNDDQAYMDEIMHRAEQTGMDSDALAQELSKVMHPAKANEIAARYQAKHLDSLVPMPVSMPAMGI